MGYLRRKADAFLESWRADPARRPLVVRGARQVGKTETIRRFARASYDSVVEVNFVEEPKYKSIVAEGYGAEDVVRAMSLVDPSKRFAPGRTLIFFDELQEFPEIATSLKFFAQDGRYDVVCSGSMLGVNYRRIESVSVGYKTDYDMRSLDFEEFLWALGRPEGEAGGLLDRLCAAAPLPEAQLSALSGAFLDFCALGGMPAVVSRFAESGTFEGSLGLQRQLLADYREDVRKYADGLDQGRILNVFDSIPSQLARENKKFQITKVARGARFGDYRGCIEWLVDAGVATRCPRLTFPELPIRGNCDESMFKLYMADTGLLVAMLDDEASGDLRANRNLGVYKGALYENAVGEALTKQGLGLCYYKRENSTLEEDFFARTRSRLVPIEVKAANGRAKSLRTLISSERYPDVSFGLKMCAGNVGFEGSVLTMPYSCAFLARRLLRAVDDGACPWARGLA